MIGLERVQDGLELASVEPVVRLVVETLEVDVGRVHELGEVAKRTFLDRAAADDDVLKSVLTGQLAGVEGVFVKGRRLGIGVGDRRAAERLCHRDNVVGKKAEARNIVISQRARKRRAEPELRTSGILGLLRLLL